MATGIPTSRTETNGCIESTDFEISYKGKKDVSEMMDSPFSISERKILVTNVDSDVENRLYFGDNIDILRELQLDDSIKGKVKLIYIDPPFATNSKFTSRNLEPAYEDTLVGAKFLEFLRERLYLMKELLHDEGSIYVHLDENMAFPVKIIMDEVFGKSNFKNWITRVKCSRKNTTRNRYGNIADYIMFYTKSPQYTWNRSYEPWTEEDIKKQYTTIDEETGQRYKKVPIHAPGVRNGETGKPWRDMIPPKGKHWQYTPQNLEIMDQKGEIYWSKTGNPRRKIYFNREPGLPVQDIWTGMRDTVNQNSELTGYPTEKNILLLDRIIKASSNEGDLILDAFSGSGTTLVAAERNSRQWVGIDSSELAIEKTIKRFAYGSKPIGDYVTKTNNERKNEEGELNSNMSVYITESNSRTIKDLDKKLKKWNNYLQPNFKE